MNKLERKLDRDGEPIPTAEDYASAFISIIGACLALSMFWFLFLGVFGRAAGCGIGFFIAALIVSARKLKGE